MQERLEFEPAEHTDFVFQVVGPAWPLYLVTMMLVAAGAVWVWWRRRS